MNNRIQIVDILRGMTLFGVMLVNTATINGPFFLNEIDFAFVFNMHDYILSEIISLLFLQKSYPIFVFLFGFGTKLLLQGLSEKLQHNNKKVFGVFAKRMLVLGIFGVLHGALFYWGDILLMYALLGFIAGSLVIFFFRSNYKSLLKFNLGLVIASVIICGYMHHNLENDQHHSSLEAHYVDTIANKANDMVDKIPAEKKELDEDINPNKGLYTNIYQNGMIKTIIANNLHSYYNSYLYGIFTTSDKIIALKNINYLLEVFILIVFGIIAASIPHWQEKIFNIEFKTIFKLLAVCGSGYAFSEYLLISQLPWVEWLDVFSIILLLNNIVLYLLIFLLAYRTILHKPIFHNTLQSFAAVGRMTLTWYLLQSFIMGLLFFNYGFGLYGKVGVAGCFIFAVIYYYCCFKISPWWLQRYQQGPIEKFWRWLTMPGRTGGSAAKAATGSI